MRWIDSITGSMDADLRKLWEGQSSLCATVHGVAKTQTQLHS